MDWSALTRISLILPFAAYFFLHHEIVEWSLLRDAGMRGTSTLLGLIVDAAAGLGGWVGYFMLVAFGYDHGWLTAVVLYLISLTTAPLHMISGTVSIQAKRKVWLVMLPIYYVDFIYLVANLSWFGLHQVPSR